MQLENSEYSINFSTNNFFHQNPQLYNALYEDKEYIMAKFIAKLFEYYGVGKDILDIGSGLGRDVDYLNSIGYKAMGLDNSQEMLDYSRKKYPNSTFVFGEQKNFSINKKFDAITCVGSTFLYNLTNKSIEQALKCFNGHLKLGGYIYIDVRNPLFFLTKDGYSWLRNNLVDEKVIKNQTFKVITRYDIENKRQILKRNYKYYFDDELLLEENLEHRLIFPQEISEYLTKSGFDIIKIFDSPAPHIRDFCKSKELVFKDSMEGRRMQVLAKKKE